LKVQRSIETFIEGTYASPVEVLVMSLTKRALFHKRGEPEESASKVIRQIISGERTIQAKGDPIVLLANNILTVRIPNFSDENDEYVRHMAHYLSWAITLLQVKKENLRFIRDSSLGIAVRLPSTINRITTNMLSSVHTSNGVFAGEVFQFGKVKANLVEILALIYELKRYSGKVRKSTVPLGSKSISVSQQILRETFNSKSGLNNPEIEGWPKQFVLNILGILTSYTNKNFPGAWIHALKVRNNVKTAEGLLQLSGYTPICVSTQKLKEVVFNRTTLINGKEKIILFDESKDLMGITHQEYRLAIVTCLPKLIDPLDLCLSYHLI